MTIRAYLYDADGTDREVPFDAQLTQTLTDRQLLWIDLTGQDRGEIEQIGEALKFHRQSVRNLLNPIGRPRLDHYGVYFQINVIAVEARPAGTETSFEPIALDFFSGPNYVVTVHPKALQFLHDFQEQVRGDTQLGELTSATFLGALMDWHVGGYFRVLDELELSVDRLDEAVLTHPDDHEFLEDLVDLRRRVGELRRLLTPHREVFAALARPDFASIAQTESAAQFRSLADRFERAVESVENARELVLGSFDLYMTGTSRRTNDSVRALTIVTVALGVIGAVAGLMGTNFEVTFFKAGNLGFALMLLAMLLLIALVLWLARRNRWI